MMAYVALCFNKITLVMFCFLDDPVPKIVEQMECLYPINTKTKGMHALHHELLPNLNSF